MKKPQVVVLKRKPNESYQQATVRALRMVDLSRILKPTDRVLIDINLLLDEDYELGNITDPRTCEGVIQFLLSDLKLKPENIIVGGGGYVSETPNAIKRCKYPEMAEKYGFRVMDLNKDKMIHDVKPSNPLSIRTVNIAKTAMDVDVIISIPSLKTHCLAVTTLSIKNMMTNILPKSMMHDNLHKKLADLLSIFSPRFKLAVIDGYIGSDGYEEGGNPVKMDLCILGTDPVAVDTVGSAIIGYSVDECKYLKYCNEKGLGECDLKNIEIIGESIKSVYRKFDR
jgi:uncharacterized protein (DUF362 family)